MTNPKSESQKRRDELAREELYDHSWPFMRGWDARDADLKKQLGLPEDCDVEAVALKMKDALIFYADERSYVNLGIRRDLYDDSGKRAREALEPFTKEQK